MSMISMHSYSALCVIPLIVYTLIFFKSETIMWPTLSL